MKKTTVGVIGAMQVEMETLRSLLENPKEESISGVTFVFGTYAGREVVTAVCGIGKVFAAICAEAMILRFHPDVIINTGVAGTLTKALSVGDVAVSTAVVQHDMDTSPLGDPMGMISGINKIEFRTGEALCRLAQDCVEEEGLHCVSGVVASGDQFIHDETRKRFLSETFHGICCEMEGGAIGHVCFVNNVDFVVIRAISDSADGSAEMDFPTFVTMAAKHSANVTKKLLEKLV